MRMAEEELNKRTIIVKKGKEENRSSRIGENRREDKEW